MAKKDAVTMNVKAYINEKGISITRISEATGISNNTGIVVEDTNAGDSGVFNSNVNAAISLKYFIK